MAAFDTRRVRPFRRIGFVRPFPPINPVPRDGERAVYISSSQVITEDTDAEKPRWLTYNTGATLDTNTGTRFYPPRKIEVRNVMVSVEGAPSSTLTGDLLRNGTSMYPSATKPTISAGNYYGALRAPDRNTVNRGDYLQCQLTATGSATGPAIFYIQYRRL
jgi:hypothetical protein